MPIEERAEDQTDGMMNSVLSISCANLSIRDGTRVTAWRLVSHFECSGKDCIVCIIW